MEIENNNLKPYDADGDIQNLSRNISKWGSIGFLRGFAGVRSEVLPKGKMNLPSAAFYEAAMNKLSLGNPDEAELERRIKYVDSVEARLREIQGEAIHQHFSQATRGQVIDGILALFIICLIAGLIARIGPTNWVTITLITLMAAKLLYMQWAVRRMLRIAHAAFKAKVDDITLPWER